jgi:hypothetical protein
MPERVTVIGGGPAGSLAALAALGAGAPVQIFEKSRLPRHKVCGEFLSPEAGPLFARFGLLPGFLELRPARVTEARIRLGRTTKSWRLKHPAFGISRYALDRWLLDQAIARGAELIPEPAGGMHERTVVAHGRRGCAPKGSRLFGFKAHFAGVPNDRIELLFAPGLYIGINRIEGGVINVCGLVAESLFKSFGFDPDKLASAHFAGAMPAGERVLDWLITGPLVHGPAFEQTDGPLTYRAGDALGFIDPFTGSGMLDAMCTGALAGRAAAFGSAPSAYARDCRRMLANQYRAAAVLRKSIANGMAALLAPFVPGRALFQVTRPSI